MEGEARAGAKVSWQCCHPLGNQARSASCFMVCLWVCSACKPCLHNDLPHRAQQHNKTLQRGSRLFPTGKSCRWLDPNIVRMGRHTHFKLRTVWLEAQLFTLAGYSRCADVNCAWLWPSHVCHHWEPSIISPAPHIFSILGHVYAMCIVQRDRMSTSGLCWTSTPESALCISNKGCDAYRYGEVTGQVIEECGFRVLRDDAVHGWLGASPDGLVQPSGLSPARLHDMYSPWAGNNEYDNVSEHAITSADSLVKFGRLLGQVQQETT